MKALLPSSTARDKKLPQSDEGGLQSRRVDVLTLREFLAHLPGGLVTRWDTQKVSENGYPLISSPFPRLCLAQHNFWL